MIQAKIRLRNGDEYVVPFVPSTLGMLLAHIDHKSEAEWDLGGLVQVKASDIESIKVEGL